RRSSIVSVFTNRVSPGIDSLRQPHTLVITHPLAASFQLPCEPIERLRERCAERLTTAVCNDTVTASNKDARLDQFVAMVAIKLDHDIIHARLVTLQALESLASRVTQSLGNIAMACGEVDVHIYPRIETG
ncbi:MAG TPA: hypothetical protein VF021_06840, partial [Longimicrobiales bacterium]